MNFDADLIGPEILQQILMTLEYNGKNSRKQTIFQDEIALLKNIWDKIKDPIKQTYDKLYDSLINYKDDNDNLVNKFSVSFHKPTYDGIDPDGSLLINSIPFDSRGTDLTGERIDINIDRSNLVEYRKSIATIIKLMVKYNAFIIVNEGHGKTSRHVLYLSLKKFLTNQYITTSFTGNSISGTLTSSGNTLYSVEHESYDNQIWTSSNVFPIHMFKDGQDLDVWILDYLDQLARSFKSSDNRYSNIDEFISLKD